MRGLATQPLVKLLDRIIHSIHLSPLSPCLEAFFGSRSNYPTIVQEIWMEIQEAGSDPDSFVEEDDKRKQPDRQSLTKSILSFAWKPAAAVLNRVGASDKPNHSADEGRNHHIQAGREALDDLGERLIQACQPLKDGGTFDSDLAILCREFVELTFFTSFVPEVMSMNYDPILLKDSFILGLPLIKALCIVMQAAKQNDTLFVAMMSALEINTILSQHYRLFMPFLHLHDQSAALRQTSLPERSAEQPLAENWVLPLQAMETIEAGDYVSWFACLVKCLSQCSESQIRQFLVRDIESDQGSPIFHVQMALLPHYDNMVSTHTQAAMLSLCQSITVSEVKRLLLVEESGTHVPGTPEAQRKESLLLVCLEKAFRSHMLTLEKRITEYREVESANSLSRSGELATTRTEESRERRCTCYKSAAEVFTKRLSHLSPCPGCFFWTARTSRAVDDLDDFLSFVDDLFNLPAFQHPSIISKVVGSLAERFLMPVCFRALMIDSLRPMPNPTSSAEGYTRDSMKEVPTDVNIDPLTARICIDRLTCEQRRGAVLKSLGLLAVFCFTAPSIPAAIVAHVYESPALRALSRALQKETCNSRKTLYDAPNQSGKDPSDRCCCCEAGQWWPHPSWLGGDDARESVLPLVRGALDVLTLSARALIRPAFHHCASSPLRRKHWAASFASDCTLGDSDGCRLQDNDSSAHHMRHLMSNPIRTIRLDAWVQADNSGCNRSAGEAKLMTNRRHLPADLHRFFVRMCQRGLLSKHYLSVMKLMPSDYVLDYTIDARVQSSRLGRPDRRERSEGPTDGEIARLSGGEEWMMSHEDLINLLGTNAGSAKPYGLHRLASEVVAPARTVETEVYAPYSAPRPGIPSSAERAKSPIDPDIPSAEAAAEPSGTTVTLVLSLSPETFHDIVVNGSESSLNSNPHSDSQLEVSVLTKRKCAGKDRSAFAMVDEEIFGRGGWHLHSLRVVGQRLQRNELIIQIRREDVDEMELRWELWARLYRLPNLASSEVDLIFELLKLSCVPLRGIGGEADGETSVSMQLAETELRISQLVKFWKEELFSFPLAVLSVQKSGESSPGSSPLPCIDLCALGDTALAGALNLYTIIPAFQVCQAAWAQEIAEGRAPAFSNGLKKACQVTAALTAFIATLRAQVRHFDTWDTSVPADSASWILSMKHYIMLDRALCLAARSQMRKARIFAYKFLELCAKIDEFRKAAGTTSMGLVAQIQDAVHCQSITDHELIGSTIEIISAETPSIPLEAIGLRSQPKTVLVATDAGVFLPQKDQVPVLHEGEGASEVENKQADDMASQHSDCEVKPPIGEYSLAREIDRVLEYQDLSAEDTLTVRPRLSDELDLTLNLKPVVPCSLFVGSNLTEKAKEKVYLSVVEDLLLFLTPHKLYFGTATVKEAFKLGTLVPSPAGALTMQLKAVDANDGNVFVLGFVFFETLSTCQAAWDALLTGLQHAAKAQISKLSQLFS